MRRNLLFYKLTLYLIEKDNNFEIYEIFHSIFSKYFNIFDELNVYQTPCNISRGYKRAHFCLHSKNWEKIPSLEKAQGSEKCMRKRACCELSQKRQKKRS